MFDGFNMSVYNVGYYLIIKFVAFMHLIPVIKVIHIRLKKHFKWI